MCVNVSLMGGGGSASCNGEFSEGRENKVRFRPV
jgi:hypothetical protein